MIDLLNPDIFSILDFVTNVEDGIVRVGVQVIIKRMSSVVNGVVSPNFGTVLEKSRTNSDVSLVLEVLLWIGLTSFPDIIHGVFIDHVFPSSFDAFYRRTLNPVLNFRRAFYHPSGTPI